jgi:hypothetical protein
VSGELQSVLLGTAGLTAAAGIALILAISRGAIDQDEARIRAAVRAATAAVLIHSSHFAEEFATGFHERFPEMLGLSSWSPGLFVSFNVFWIATWAVSIRGLAARRRIALWPLWFLGIASGLNGLAHPLLALRFGGYFPGLVTSTLSGVAGVLLFRRLLLATAKRDPQQALV